jgi:CubicO group peptidase (beta-lactamase class C family)
MVEPKVMGYQFVLIKDGKLITEGAGGKARTGTDGDLDMTTSTPQNIGSLAKFLTGTAMINLFEKPTAKADYIYKQSGLQGSLDRPVWGEFPKVWLDAIPGPNILGNTQRKITYRQLLQHRSGFDEDWKGMKKLNTFLSMLTGEFNYMLYDQRKYANMNFTLGGYLLPLIENKSLNLDLDAEVGNMNSIGADIIVRDRLGKRMDALMRERIWNKMTPKFNITCDAKKDLKDTAAYGYKSKQEKGGGIFDSMIEQNGHCVGSGGYFTSARDFANYVAHFSSTDLIVTKEGRDAMYKEGMPANDRIVWTGATAPADNWIAANFKQSRVAWSNGVDDGNRTVLLQLPDNYYLILFTTSPELSVGDLFNIGTLVFKEGMKHNF